MNLTKRVSLWVLTLVVVSGCELTQQDIDNLQNAFGVPGAPGGPAAPPPAQDCYADQFVQPAATVTNKIDILFVTDTSGSIIAEREAIANGIHAFVGQLPVGVDYQIGVMLAHGPTSAHYARFYQKAGEPAVLKSSELSLGMIQEYLRWKLAQPASHYVTDGGELSFGMIMNGLTMERVGVLRNETGFFRDDAALAVVFISDEQDICYDYPAGVTPVYDVEGLEAPAKAAYCKVTLPNGSQIPVTPELVFQRFYQIQENNPLLISAIVYSDLNNVPAGGENEYGYGYMDLIGLSQGLAVNMASGSYDQGLAQIGQLATQQLNLMTHFSLTNTPVDAATVEVYLDGVQTNSFTFLPATQQVHMASPGGALSVIDVNYCKEPDNGGGDPGGEPPCTGFDCGPIGV